MHRPDDILLPHPGHRVHPGHSHAQPQFHVDRVYLGTRPTSRGDWDTGSDVMNHASPRHAPRFSSSRSLDLEDRAVTHDPYSRSSGFIESRGEFYAVPGTSARHYGAQRMSSLCEDGHPAEAIPMTVYRASRSMTDAFDGPYLARQGSQAMPDSGTEELHRRGQPRLSLENGCHGKWRRSGSEFTGMVTRMQPGYRSGAHSMASLTDGSRFGETEESGEREGKRDRGTGERLYRESVSDLDGYNMYRPESL